MQHARRATLAGTILAGMALAVMVQPQLARAEAIQAHSGDLSTQLDMLATGDQLVIQNVTGDVRFGGQSITLEEFSGVAGFGSDIAYLITISGAAQLGEGAQQLVAEPGRMMLVPPFGQQADVQRYDARRLYDALASEAAVGGMQTVTMLGDLARLQDRGVFLGRLGRTSFNVATMGSAAEEMGRRERVGGTHVRNVRFTGDTGSAGLEQQIVTRFLAALAAGESAVVAEMLDPLPYGMGAMSSGGDKARLAMASSLVAQRDWSAFAAAAPERLNETTWRAAGTNSEATIGLRRTTEFAFIETIEVGS